MSNPIPPTAYFKLGPHLYYSLTKGRCHSVNTERKQFKTLNSVPSGHVNNVEIIDKEIFDNALKEIGFIL